MTLNFKDLAKDPNQMIKIYKQLIDNPKNYHALINSDEKLEHSLIATAVIVLLASLPGIATDISSLIWLPIGIAIIVTFTCIGCGVIHLIRDFLQAKGDFTRYLSFTAWITLLLLPATVTLNLLANLTGIGAISTLTSAISIVLWFYAFHKVFHSELNKTTIVAVILLILTVGPSSLMNSLDTSKYNQAALEAQNSELEKKMAELELLQQERQQREQDYEENQNM